MTVGIFIAIFVTLYLGSYFLDILLSRLNLRHMLQYKDAPPKPFAPFVNMEKYHQIMNYTIDYRNFGLVYSGISCALFLMFVYLGWMNWFDVQVRSLVTNEIVRGIMFFITLSILASFLEIPCSLYITFVIEEKYGFNRQTLKLWIKDEIKSMIINFFVILPFGALVLYFMEHTGQYWWIFAWTLFVVYSFILSIVYPVFIAPLFNKFNPLEQGELRNTIEKMAERAQYPLKNIFIMDASKRSTHANAYFTGFGKVKRLVLYDCLLKDFEINEIAAIVAHEIGHFHKKHIWKYMFLSSCTSLGFFYLLNLALTHSYLYQTFFIEAQSKYMGIVLLSCVTAVVASYISPLGHLLNWKFETEADSYSLGIVENKEAIKTMLIKLAINNLANLAPHPWYAMFSYTHPPILKRLEDMGLVTPEQV